MVICEISVQWNDSEWNRFYCLQRELSLKHQQKRECRLARAKKSSSSSNFSNYNPVPFSSSAASKILCSSSSPFQSNSISEDYLELPFIADKLELWVGPYGEGEKEISLGIANSEQDSALVQK